MRGRLFQYRAITVDGKRRTVKTTGNRGDRWAYEFAVADPAKPSGRRSVSKAGFETKSAAQAALTTALAEYESGGRRTPTEPSTMALSDYVRDVWMPAVSHNLKPTTIDSYSNLHRAYIEPHVGRVRMRDLDAHTLTRLYATLETSGRRNGRGLSPMTVHHVAVLLTTILEYAVEAGDLRTNPAKSIPKNARRKQPKRSPDRLLFWTPDEASRFLASSADDHLHPLYALALWTGMRRGELAGLQWRDVQLVGDEPHLTVSRQRNAVDGATIEQDPKTTRSARRIPLGPEAVAMLREHRKRQATDLAALRADDRGWVFVDVDGRPLDPTSITRRLESAAGRAGLPWIGVHGLRHTHAVGLLRAGVPLKVVSERLGHTSTAFTADVYQHVIPGMQEEASNVIEGLFRVAR
jgi:integrase